MRGDEYYDAYWGEQGFVPAGDMRNPHLLSLIRALSLAVPPCWTSAAATGRQSLPWCGKKR
jgi:hypothetical protein